MKEFKSTAVAFLLNEVTGFPLRRLLLSRRLLGVWAMLTCMSWLSVPAQDYDVLLTNTFEANRVWHNDGSGLLNDSGQSLGFREQSYGVALADFDGDGDLDAAVANWAEPNRIWLNEGEGYFLDSGQELGGEQNGAVGVGDFDGDGDVDLLMGTAFDAGSRVWFNDGSGRFTVHHQVLPPMRDVTIADFDGDGYLDFFAAGLGMSKGLNNGRGTFEVSTRGDVLNLFAIKSGDLDADGDVDLLVVGIDGNWALFNNGAGVFDQKQPLPGEYQTYGTELADVDGDGDLDAFLFNTWSPDEAPNLLFLNDGAGGFLDSGVELGVLGQDGRAADFDNDGDVDLAVVRLSSSAENEIWYNNGRGVFERGPSLGGGLSHSLAVGFLTSNFDLAVSRWGLDPNRNILKLVTFQQQLTGPPAASFSRAEELHELLKH